MIKIAKALALLVLVTTLSGAAPLSALCRDCILGTSCVNLADGFGFRNCTQIVRCRQLCIRYDEGDYCQEWIEFNCYDAGCRVSNPCSGYLY